MLLPAAPAVVVTAPTGAGKSTILPLSILTESSGKILMLEPRRIAARAVAERLAELHGSPLGQTVGYRIRRESKVSAATRLEVVTEGILTRMLIDDATLDGVSVVIFDEYHERSIHSDVALALTREVQRVLRPDLRIVILSATIDAEAICAELQAEHVTFGQQPYPVRIERDEEATPQNCAELVAHAVYRALGECEGDILAFLPGQADILRCAERLTNISAAVVPLYGALSAEEQRRAIRPSADGTRRVVLATSIAETSLTIPGVRVVIDSGLHRKPVFDARTGLSHLETVRISQDMATQRTGRAGRLSEGVCYRLYSPATERNMALCRRPEILEADLSPVLLATAAFGAEGLGESLPWMTMPPQANLRRAAEILRALGAFDAQNRLTPLGRRMAREAAHPRIAKMLVTAHDDTERTLARQIALALENPTAARPIMDQDAGRLLAAAFPERVGHNLGNGKIRLASGDNATLDARSPLYPHEWIAVAELTGSHIQMAAPLRAEDMPVVERDVFGWRDGAIVAQHEWRCGVHLVQSRPLTNLSAEQVDTALCEAARKDGASMFSFDEAVQQLQRRVAFLAARHPELSLPDFSMESILSRASDWLPYCRGRATTSAELRKIDLTQALLVLLTYDQQQALDRLAPTHITMPSGRRARIDYRQGAEAPVLSVRLQECFGMNDTPTVDGDRQPLLMELLSPGFKPVQLTSDLCSFWQNTYAEVRKELRRRYPKHSWPDDPSSFIIQNS